MIEVGIDPKHDSISLSSVKWMLHLVGPDMAAKPWNYHNEFIIYLEEAGRTPHLFQLKDARFGCLSRCCALVCYHFDDIREFLDNHDYVTIKLACLVRDACNQEYIKVVVVVVAALGVHVITPYHSITISSTTDHSSLQTYLNNLYTSLTNFVVTPQFFELDRPMLGGISQNLFDSVLQEYKLDVIASVRLLGQQYTEQCVMLAKLMLPRLAETVLRQRGAAYNIAGAGTPEENVFNQCPNGNVDSLPVHNMESERQCGSVDNRLNKKHSLQAASRDIILKLTSGLRAGSDKSFRNTKTKTVKNIKILRDNFEQRQHELRVAGLNEKEAKKLNVENRKNTILAQIRAQGGPFVSEIEIDDYLADDSVPAEVKNKRMRAEITYARDTCISLPRAHPFFKIFDTSVKPRRLLTADQYGENLKLYLGKAEGRAFVSLQEFSDALNALNNG